MALYNSGEYRILHTVTKVTKTKQDETQVVTYECDETHLCGRYLLNKAISGVFTSVSRHCNFIGTEGRHANEFSAK